MIGRGQAEDKVGAAAAVCGVAARCCTRCDFACFYWWRIQLAAYRIVSHPTTSPARLPLNH